MNKCFVLALIVFFTVFFQAQLSAIHAPENTIFEIDKVSEYSQTYLDGKGYENNSIRNRKANKKSRKFGVGRFTSKIIIGISKILPPRKLKDPGSGMAIASLVLGILGILTLPYLILPVLAIIFGAISFKKYNEGYHDRRRAAKAGLILGIIGAALSIIVIAAIVATF